ncbi:MAG: hypothetical protein A3E78_13480 [Alphaproteobacteria bacterium RIFCSPHIGHO2_12_FULL_63_12]|nr:MAG: hypothetical protein A3E78_13480 [Alphaproteobacteria bacterium RIFCSPHIGHO2_12_FULL_63_12]
MTFEEIYYISQIVAVIVIVLTLLAILWQAHQTNTIARAELTLNWWMAAGALNQSSVDSEDKAAFLTRVFDPSATLSREDMTRIAFQMHTQVGVFQAAYALSRRGLVEDTSFALAKRGNSRFFIASAIARQWWRAHRGDGYAPEFQKIMDDIVSEAEATVSAGSVGVKDTA